MSRRSVWSILGVPATAERDDIRRAYARKLKVTNPEDDAEGFQALREAYEAALRHADWNARRQAHGWDEDDDDYEEAEGAVVAASPEPAVAEAQTAAGAADTAVPPAGPPRPNEIEVLEQRHQALCDRLLDLAKDPKSDAAALEAAFRAVLASPAMDIVRVHENTERWLGMFIGGMAPMTDSLIEPAIAHFRWDDNYVGRRNPHADPTLARRSQIQFLKAQPCYLAARDALSQPPRGRRLRRNILSTSESSVRDLLALIEEHPVFRASFDEEAIAWWTARLARPHLGASVWWSLILSAPFALLAAVLGVTVGVEALTPFAVLAGLLATPAMGLAAWHFAVSLPRSELADLVEREPWLRVGWLPAAVLPVVVAALVPPAWEAGGALALLSLPGLIWALWLGEPDTRKLSGEGWTPLDHYSLFGVALNLTQWAWRPNMPFPWVLRAIFAYFYLACFWRRAAIDMDHAVWVQMTLPLALAAATCVMGQGSLDRAWRFELPEKTRRIMAMALGGLAALAAGLLAFAYAPELRTPAALLTVVAVLIHKAPASQLGGRGSLVRDVSVRFGWLAWAVLSLFVLGQDALPLRFAGFWILTGVAVTVFFVLAGEGAPEARAKKAKRPVWDR